MYCFQKHHPEVFLWKGVLKICSKFTGEHPCRSAISIKLLSNLIEITLRLGCSTVDLLHIFRTPFHRNTSWWLLLYFGGGSLLRQRALFCGDCGTLCRNITHDPNDSLDSLVKYYLRKDMVYQKVADVLDACHVIQISLIIFKRKLETMHPT